MRPLSPRKEATVTGRPQQQRSVRIQGLRVRNGEVPRLSGDRSSGQCRVHSPHRQQQPWPTQLGGSGRPTIRGPAQHALPRIGWPHPVSWSDVTGGSRAMRPRMGCLIPGFRLERILHGRYRATCPLSGSQLYLSKSLSVYGSSRVFGAARILASDSVRPCPSIARRCGPMSASTSSDHWLNETRSRGR
jgi:hypothetical protein